ncbi:hypothetical protein HYC85_003932 [Camellia sinensis]|uniref:Uncharacterized protein n=1 Tax=Camellia sinensis TaxID=4442 RepID=A0A7J7HWA8_CAMSI|nr:hypothetical protein HYC85_003932 [Camellia sinensis]
MDGQVRFSGILSQELSQNPVEYMSLPASQYSMLDAGSIEKVDNSTFRCYVYNFKFFAFEVCPVLLLEGSPIVVAQNEKIDGKKFIQILFVCCKMVSIEIPFAFRPIPVQAIESTDTQVLEQILRIMLPCFTAQVCDLDIFPL